MKASILKLKREIALRLPSTYLFIQKGICPCCGKKTTFFSRNSWLREFFCCLECGCIPRERAMTIVLKEIAPNYENLTIHESSPGNRGLSSLLKKNCTNYIETQFFPNIELGQNFNGYRNENLEKQTFADETFDIVITQDVLEHLYNPEQAFKEIERTLKPGGMHIFTVPFSNYHNSTERWATQNENGEPIFLHKPEWHGNPINKNGSPVTMHYGYDLVDIIKKTSGMETRIIKRNDLLHGIYGDAVEVCVSTKNKF